MSIWQYNAALSGYAKIHSPKAENKIASKEQEDELFEFALRDSKSFKEKYLSNTIYLWDGEKFTIDSKIQFEVS